MVCWGYQLSTQPTRRVWPAYRLPGLSRRAAAVVVERVEEACADWDRPTGRKRELSVLDALKMALCRLRTNATYAALGADFGVSTSVA